jgi:hypothetical protein
MLYNYRKWEQSKGKEPFPETLNMSKIYKKKTALSQVVSRNVNVNA